MEFELAFVKLSEDKIRVDAAVGCGKRFEGIALIHDPYLFKPDGSLAASLQLTKPLGFSAVQEIIKKWTLLALQFYRLRAASSLKVMVYSTLNCSGRFSSTFFWRLHMDPTEYQYLVLNALATLDLVNQQFYDMDTGTWFLETRSLLLPFCRLMPDGEILPLEINYE